MKFEMVPLSLALPESDRPYLSILEAIHGPLGQLLVPADSYPSPFSPMDFNQLEALLNNTDDTEGPYCLGFALRDWALQKIKELKQPGAPSRTEANPDYAVITAL